MKIRFVPVIILFTSFFCVVNTKGFDSPTLPASLPMGSVEIFRSWIVTNQIVGVDCSLYFTNKSGEAEAWGNFGGKTFKTYRAYQQFVATNGLGIFTEHYSTIDLSKSVRFVHGIFYSIPELKPNDIVECLRVNTNIGLASSITSNSFLNLPTQTEFAQIHVPGLEKFVVEVKGVYTNSWPAPIIGPGVQSDSPTKFPTELTTNNYVVLNPWYSIGDTNETRITIQVGGNIRKYTKFGSPLDKPPVMAITKNYVTASFARGAWVTFETSSDRINWSSITNISDSDGIGSISISYTKNQPQQFYRVGIW